MEDSKEAFKLYLKSYCSGDLIYNHTMKLHKVDNKPIGSYIKDVNLAKNISDDISKTNNIDELESIAVKINMILSEK